VAAVLDAGASAALLGTRFLLSDEANARPYYKARLLRARTDDLLLDTRLIGDWPCAPRRRLVTALDEDVPALFAGQGVSRMREMLPAAEIVRLLTPRRPRAVP
jgi:nitronate monooxygenase